jgi:hypothetical protein
MKKTPGVAFYGKVRIPTIGHKTAIDAAKEISKRVKGKLTIGLSGTAEPLDLKTKKSLAQKIFNHPVNTGTPETKTLASFLTHLNKSHDELHLVAGSDRVAEYKSFIDRYNGKPDRSGKAPFTYKKVEVHTAGGERVDSDKDPREMSQAELTSSVSASKLEKLAKEGNWEHFKAYHPGMPDSHVRRVFTKIRAHHGLNKLEEAVNIGLTFARKEMPQIGAAASFVKYLRDNDIESQRTKIDPNDLKSSQMEFDNDKVESLRMNPSKNPIIVSNDGHILDGHHRWLADQKEGRKTDAVVCNMPILDLLYHAKHYSKNLTEEVTRKELAPMLDSFVSFASDKLGLKSMPNVRYKTDDDDYNSFAAYNPASNELSVHTMNRHPMDIFRSVAHELVHHKQNEDGRIGKDIAKEGETGSDIENEANAEAGKIMRWFAKANPDMFGKTYVVEGNTTSFGGIRGLGNVTGEVSPTDVPQYVLDNQAYTNQIKNNTSGLWVDDGVQSYWLDKKGSGEYRVKAVKGFKAMRAQLNEVTMSSPASQDLAKSLEAKRQGKESRQHFVRPGASNDPEPRLSNADPNKFKSSTPIINKKADPNRYVGSKTDTIKMKMGGKEKEIKTLNINPNVGQKLEEGINDPGKLKAIFLAGGPGSGKDFVMNSVLAGEGLREVNSDTAFEFLMKKHGLNMKMPKEEKVERDIVRGKAKKTTKKKEELSLAGRLGLIINGTADDLEKIKRVKSELESDGYETMMVFVNTSNDVSRQRNLERGQGGGRKVPDGTDDNGVPDDSEDIRTEKWQLAQENIGELQKVFGNDKFVVLDNSVDIRKASPEVKAKVMTDFNRVRRMTQQFVRSENQNPNAKKWIERETQKRDITDYKAPKAYAPVAQTRQSIPQVVHQPDNELMAQARRLGLSYYGFGRFGRKVNGVNKVMYHSKGGKLVRVQTLSEDLRQWFSKTHPKGNWKRVDTKGNIKGDCAREPGEGKPKCMPASKAYSMSKEDRAKSARRKRREDPVADRSGKGNKPVMVKTESVQKAIDKINRDRMTEENLMEKNKPTNPALWSKAKSLARSKFDVYPSAYANGWASKWYKSKGGGWKSVNEEKGSCWSGYEQKGMKKKGNRMVPNCVPVNEGHETIKFTKMRKGSNRPKMKITRKLAENINNDFMNFMEEHGAGDFGTDKLRRNYEKATPKQPVRKKIVAQEDELPLKMGYGLPIIDSGLGPETSQYRQMAAMGFGAGLPLSESIMSWMHNEKTQDKFIAKYGKLAEEKLIETALMLEKASCGCDHSGAKSVKKLKEMAASSGKDPMDTRSPIGVQNKDEITERELSDAEMKKREEIVMALKRKGMSKDKAFAIATARAKQVAEEHLNERGADSKGLYRSTESGAGLTRKGAKHFGIKTAVTTPPSKLDPKGKAAKRRKSFCARMGGMPGPMKDEKGRPTRKAMSLRRWNCEE